MAEFFHSILTPYQTVSAGTVNYSLPPNPLSAILLHISPTNNSGADRADYQFMPGLLDAIDNVTITWRGMTVVSINGDDLAALAVLSHNMRIWQSGDFSDDNFIRSLVIPILFSRRPYMQNECFPATKCGEFTMSITWDTIGTGFDALKASIETIQLPNARPGAFQRVTTISQTFTATGQNDIILPLGNEIRGILLWGAAGFVGISPAPTLGQLSLLVDDLQKYFANTYFPVLRGLSGIFGRDAAHSYGHQHFVPDPGLIDVVGRQNEAATWIAEASMIDHYACMNIDVMDDDAYSLDASTVSSVKVRSIAEATGAVRVLPIERVAVNFMK